MIDHQVIIEYFSYSCLIRSDQAKSHIKLKCSNLFFGFGTSSEKIKNECAQFVYLPHQYFPIIYYSLCIIIIYMFIM